MIRLAPALLLLVAALGPARANDYPSRVVTIVVPKSSLRTIDAFPSAT